MRLEKKSRNLRQMLSLSFTVVIEASHATNATVFKNQIKSYCSHEMAHITEKRPTFLSIMNQAKFSLNRILIYRSKRSNLCSPCWITQKVDLLHFAEVLIFCWNIQSRGVAWFHTGNCCAKHCQYVFGSQLGGDNALHYLSQFLSLAVLSFYSLTSK